MGCLGKERNDAPGDATYGLIRKLGAVNLRGGGHWLNGEELDDSMTRIVLFSFDILQGCLPVWCGYIDH